MKILFIDIECIFRMEFNSKDVDKKINTMLRIYCSFMKGH